MSERTKDAAMRGAIVVLSVYLAAVATDRVLSRTVPPTPTYVLPAVFVSSWEPVRGWPLRRYRRPHRRTTSV